MFVYYIMYEALETYIRQIIILKFNFECFIFL